MDQLSPNKALENRSNSISGFTLAAGGYALVGGLLSLLGWVLNIPRLTDWNNEGISIKANTAICITAAGAGLIISLLRPRYKLLIRILAASAAVVAGLTLFEHISGIDLGIDTLLFHEPLGAKATSSPGRMGIPASTAITSIGVGLFLSTFRDRKRQWASIFGTLAFCISTLSLTGYLFGANQLYAIPRYTGIALQTATMVAALGVGIAAIVPEYGFFSVLWRKDAGGVVLRRLCLPLIVLSLSLGWIRVLGQDMGLYDTAFGTAVRTLVEIVLLLGLLWWTARDISRSATMAREAAAAVADRDERMHGVLESLSDAFVSFDQEFRITYANTALMGMLKQYGIDGSQIFGKKAAEVIPDIGETSLGRSLDRAMKERISIDFEDHFAPFDRWFHARCLPTSDGGVSLFALDISEQKKGEQLLTRRANELGVLYGFADRLNRSLSSHQVYDEALATIGKALGCDRASILLFDEDGVMSFVAAQGLSDEYKTAVTGHSPWKQGDTSACPFGIDDIENSDLDAHLKSVIAAEGISALAFIPLLYNDVLIGKFMVYYDRPHTFTEHEFEIALTVGYQIAIGIERTRTQDALRENEERLRLATQTGKVGVWDWDIRGNKVSWTESVYAMHGVKPGGFDGSVEGFAALVHPDDRSFVNSRIQMALSDEAPYDIEFRVAMPDGSVNWLFTNALVLRDAAGPYRMIGATIDVTDRKLAEQELAKAAAIVDSSRDAIVSKDLNGIITSWNRGAEKVFGYASDEVIGKPITIIIPQDRLNEEKEILERIQRGEPTDHFETVRQRKDGTLLNISLTVSPVRDANGQIIGASKIARDITEHKRAATAVRDREIMHRLVEAQEAERHRIARDLHDHLGQQLTALRLKLESIRSKTTDPLVLDEVAETQAYATRIDMDINYLAWELRPTELDNLGLIDSLSSFVREWSTTYAINAEFHSSRNKNGRYNAELETNLYRIVQEALNNILKHADAKSVNVLLEERDDLLILIIEDDGDGFKPDSARRNGSSGKGLGLIGMRERTALLGGTLEIETRPGEGTTIYARVPVRPADTNGHSAD